MIFLGETFNGFISVHNHSQEVVKEVILKVLQALHVHLCVCHWTRAHSLPHQVELLTPSHRHLLLSDPPMTQLDPGSCEERTIAHEVKELGEHR